MDPTDILQLISSPAQLELPAVPPIDGIANSLLHPLAGERAVNDNSSKMTPPPPPPRPQPPIALQLSLLYPLAPFTILTPTNRILPLGKGYSRSFVDPDYSHPFLNPDHPYSFSAIGGKWRQALAAHAPLVGHMIFDLSFPRAHSVIADPGPAAERCRDYGWHFEKAFELSPREILQWVVDITTDVRTRMERVGRCRELDFEVVYGGEDDDKLGGFSEEWKATLQSRLAFAMRWPGRGSRMAGGIVELA
ncbi:hypothetical protein B0J18DRAFT_406371 [Chaetomium sp. MPI-SDFR-AT-0129]|nr:hypothetical protein B0J18DRAFT_406371 [Chaetomium sp. MPI-SDFR-AT-0129]